MADEVEVKLRSPDPEKAREAVRRLGAQLVRLRHLEDNLLFDDAGGSLRASGTVLRLRQTPAGGFLTLKGPRVPGLVLKMREERETAVEDVDEVRAILAGLGYRPVFRYQKYRESWSWRGQELEIDETPIGTFIEIEGDEEGIRAAAIALGYAVSDYVNESYVTLFFASGGKGDMVFAE
jgi:adenylate cyclase class 2